MAKVHKKKTEWMNEWMKELMSLWNNLNKETKKSKSGITFKVSIFKQHIERC